jgi:hypothetical protein
VDHDVIGPDSLRVKRPGSYFRPDFRVFAGQADKAGNARGPCGGMKADDVDHVRSHLSSQGRTGLLAFAQLLLAGEGKMSQVVQRPEIFAANTRGGKPIPVERRTRNEVVQLSGEFRLLKQPQILGLHRFYFRVKIIFCPHPAIGSSVVRR